MLATSRPTLTATVPLAHVHSILSFIRKRSRIANTSTSTAASARYDEQRPPAISRNAVALRRRAGSCVGTPSGAGSLGLPEGTSERQDVGAVTVSAAMPLNS